MLVRRRARSPGHQIRREADGDDEHQGSEQHPQSARNRPAVMTQAKACSSPRHFKPRGAMPRTADKLVDDGRAIKLHADETRSPEPAAQQVSMPPQMLTLIGVVQVAARLLIVEGSPPVRGTSWNRPRILRRRTTRWPGTGLPCSKPHSSARCPLLGSCSSAGKSAGAETMDRLAPAGTEVRARRCLTARRAKFAPQSKA